MRTRHTVSTVITLFQPELYHIISYHLFICSNVYEKYSKCQHAVAELDGQGSKGTLIVAYKNKIKNGIQHKPSKSHKKQNILIQHRQLRTYGKTTKINFKERTPKFLYRTEVDNIGWKCIPYIYYSLAKKCIYTHLCIQLWFQPTETNV